MHHNNIAQYTAYKGSKFSINSPYMAMFTCILWIIAALIYNKFNPVEYILTAICIIPIFGFIYILMVSISNYYVVLSSATLLIKNNVLYWVEVKYNLSDISEISIEDDVSSYRKSLFGAYNIVIKTNHSDVKTYQSATLSYRDWNRLKMHLNTLGIKTTGAFD